MNQTEKDFYDGEYMPQMNRIGKITGFAGVILCFCPALALAVVYGLLPQPAALVTAVVAGAASFGALWFVEPISYFPVLGTVGTYMAFLSGNISNMRVPCASVAQAAAGVEPGSPKASVIATLGMAVSIVMNISILTVGVILGSSVLSMLPAAVTEALSYLLPSLFGALLVQFAMKKIRLGVVVLLFGILIYLAINGGLFAWLPGASNYLPVLGCIFFSIAVAMLTVDKGKEGEKK
ncbi:MAG: hypothetical protein LUE86_04965 [Clostridiales bacterium]|nr:hypothetical protein [Clostridiales bacterium]